MSFFTAGASECKINVTPDIVDNSLHATMSIRFDEKAATLRLKHWRCLSIRHM